MKQKNIEQELKAWLALMQQKYTWLSIKFEFNEEYKCYLVSFSPSSKSIQNKDFCRDVLDFEDKVNEEYEFDAPLFCDDEDLYKLSDKAQTFPSLLERKAFTKDLYSILSQLVLTEEEDTQNLNGETDQYSFYYDGYNKYDIAV